MDQRSVEDGDEQGSASKEPFLLFFIFNFFTYYMLIFLNIVLFCVAMNNEPAVVVFWFLVKRTQILVKFQRKINCTGEEKVHSSEDSIPIDYRRGFRSLVATMPTRTQGTSCTQHRTNATRGRFYPPLEESNIWQSKRRTYGRSGKTRALQVLGRLGLNSFWVVWASWALGH